MPQPPDFPPRLHLTAHIRIKYNFQVMKYAICEILGNQYLVEPNKTLFIHGFGGDEKQLKVDKVLIMADGDKIEVGSPYLKTSLNFEVLDRKRVKTRVATYKSKTNHHRVIGSTRVMTQIKLVEEKKAVKSRG